MDVNLAEEGVLRLLFVAAYLMFDKISSDNEVSAASRYQAFLYLLCILVMVMYSGWTLKYLCPIYDLSSYFLRHKY